MKRLLLLLAAFMTVAAVAAVSAAGTPPPPTPTSLALDQPADVTIPYGEMTASIALTGTITHAPGKPGVDIWWTTGSSCPTPESSHDSAHVTGSESPYAFDLTVEGLGAGTYTFMAVHGETASNCVTVEVASMADPSIVVSAPQEATVGVAFEASGTLLGPGGEPAADQDVYVQMFAGGCSLPEYILTEDPVSTGANGVFTKTFTPTETGVFGVVAASFDYDSPIGDCTEVTVGTAPVAPAYTPGVIPDTYLCWNHDMVNPVAYADDVADTMWKTGNYFEPQAILGNVADGTNIGAYHLVCNAPSTMTMTDTAIGGSGELYGPDAVAAYHQDHPVNGNDLNIYHVWK